MMMATMEDPTAVIPITPATFSMKVFSATALSGFEPVILVVVSAEWPSSISRDSTIVSVVDSYLFVWNMQVDLMNEE